MTPEYSHVYYGTDEVMCSSLSGSSEVIRISRVLSCLLWYWWGDVFVSLWIIWSDQDLQSTLMFTMVLMRWCVRLSLDHLKWSGSPEYSHVYYGTDEVMCSSLSGSSEVIRISRVLSCLLWYWWGDVFVSLWIIWSDQDLQSTLMFTMVLMRWCVRLSLDHLKSPGSPEYSHVYYGTDEVMCSSLSGSSEVTRISRVLSCLLWYWWDDVFVSLWIIWSDEDLQSTLMFTMVLMRWCVRLSLDHLKSPGSPEYSHVYYGTDEVMCSSLSGSSEVTRISRVLSCLLWYWWDDVFVSLWIIWSDEDLQSTLMFTMVLMRWCVRLSLDHLKWRGSPEYSHVYYGTDEVMCSSLSGSSEVTRISRVLSCLLWYWWGDVFVSLWIIWSDQDLQSTLMFTMVLMRWCVRLSLDHLKWRGSPEYSHVYYGTDEVMCSSLSGSSEVIRISRVLSCLLWYWWGDVFVSLWIIWSDQDLQSTLMFTMVLMRWCVRLSLDHLKWSGSPEYSHVYYGSDEVMCSSLSGSSEVIRISRVLSCLLWYWWDDVLVSLWIIWSHQDLQSTLMFTMVLMRWCVRLSLDHLKWRGSPEYSHVYYGTDEVMCSSLSGSSEVIRISRVLSCLLWYWWGDVFVSLWIIWSDQDLQSTLMFTMVLMRWCVRLSLDHLKWSGSPEYSHVYYGTDEVMCSSLSGSSEVIRISRVLSCLLWYWWGDVFVSLWIIWSDQDLQSTLMFTMVLMRWCVRLSLDHLKWSGSPEYSHVYYGTDEVMCSSLSGSSEVIRISRVLSCLLWYWWGDVLVSLWIIWSHQDLQSTLMFTMVLMRWCVRLSLDHLKSPGSPEYSHVYYGTDEVMCSSLSGSSEVIRISRVLSCLLWYWWGDVFVSLWIIWSHQDLQSTLMFTMVLMRWCVRLSLDHLKSPGSPEYSHVYYGTDEMMCSSLSGSSEVTRISRVLSCLLWYWWGDVFVSLWIIWSHQDLQSTLMFTMVLMRWCVRLSLDHLKWSGSPEYSHVYYGTDEMMCSSLSGSSEVTRISRVLSCLLWYWWDDVLVSLWIIWSHQDLQSTLMFTMVLMRWCVRLSLDHLKSPGSPEYSHVYYGTDEVMCSSLSGSSEVIRISRVLSCLLWYWWGDVLVSLWIIWSDQDLQSTLMFTMVLMRWCVRLSLDHLKWSGSPEYSHVYYGTDEVMCSSLSGSSEVTRISRVLSCLLWYWWGDVFVSLWIIWSHQDLQSTLLFTVVLMRWCVRLSLDHLKSPGSPEYSHVYYGTDEVMCSSLSGSSEVIRISRVLSCLLWYWWGDVFVSLWIIWSHQDLQSTLMFTMVLMRWCVRLSLDHLKWSGSPEYSHVYYGTDEVMCSSLSGSSEVIRISGVLSCLLWFWWGDVFVSLWIIWSDQDLQSTLIFTMVLMRWCVRLSLDHLKWSGSPEYSHIYYGTDEVMCSSLSGSSEVIRISRVLSCLLWYWWGDVFVSLWIIWSDQDLQSTLMFTMVLMRWCVRLSLDHLKSPGSQERGWILVKDCRITSGKRLFTTKHRESALILTDDSCI